MKSVEPDWEDVRRDYHGTALKTAEILAKYKITGYALEKRIKNDAWTVRLSATQITAAKRAARTATSPAANAAPAAGTGKPLKPIAQRRIILARLHSTVLKRLARLEARVDGPTAKDDGAIDAADFEREVRSISHLIKSLEHATEFEHDQRGKRISGAAAKSASIAATALADEADRLRRELAERLQRLVDPAGE